MIRSGYNISESKSFTNDLVSALNQRLCTGCIPNDIPSWLNRQFRKYKGRKAGRLIYDKFDVLALLYSISHPALTPLSRSLLCLHLIGGIPNNLLVSKERSIVQWSDRLDRALRALSLSIYSDMTSFQHLCVDREESMLDTLYRSIVLCNRFSFPHIRTYLVSIFTSLAPHLENISEKEAFLSWIALSKSCRYAQLFDYEIRHQDRQKWDQVRIKDAMKQVALAQSLATNWESMYPRKKTSTWGPMCLRASILSLHLQSPSYQKTPWERIVRLHLLLLSFDKSTEQLLAYMEALCHVQGPEQVLPIFQRPLPEDYRWIHAYAQILKQMGRKQEALVLYQQALCQAPELEQDAILNDMIDL